MLLATDVVRGRLFGYFGDGGFAGFFNNQFQSPTSVALALQNATKPVRFLFVAEPMKRQVAIYVIRAGEHSESGLSRLSSSSSSIGPMPLPDKMLESGLTLTSPGQYQSAAYAIPHTSHATAAVCLYTTHLLSLTLLPCRSPLRMQVYCRSIPRLRGAV